MYSPRFTQLQWGKQKNHTLWAWLPLRVIRLSFPPLYPVDGCRVEMVDYLHYFIPSVKPKFYLIVIIIYHTIPNLQMNINISDILNICIRIEDYQSWSNTSIWQHDRSGIFRFFSTSSCTTFYPSTEILWLLRMVLSWVSADCRQHTSLDCCSVCDDKWC